MNRRFRAEQVGQRPAIESQGQAKTHMYLDLEMQETIYLRSGCLTQVQKTRDEQYLLRDAGRQLWQELLGCHETTLLRCNLLNNVATRARNVSYRFLNMHE